MSYDGDTFKVEVNVSISKDRHGGYGPEESVSFNQNFRIIAIGWTKLSEVLGNLDDAVGDIKRKYTPREGNTDADPCSQCGNQFPPNQICYNCQ